MSESKLDEIKAIIEGTSPIQRQKEREDILMALGYNQAMLHWATFPITGAGDTLTRAEVERTVARLKQKLEID